MVAVVEEDTCLEQNTGRRRVFWTTQPQACEGYSMCGTECVIPGLQYENFPDATYPEPLRPSLVDAQSGGVYRSIKNTGWLISLVLNILNTRSRTDVKCPTPAAVYGHWSESYRDDGLYIGSTLWNTAEKSYVRINDAVKAIGAAVRADMGKLIALGIAESVEVEAYYRGASSVEIQITVFTVTGRSKLNLSGNFVSESWEWR